MTNVRSTADYFGVGADCGWTPDVHVFDGLSAETVESNIEYWCQYLVSNPLKPLKTRVRASTYMSLLLLRVCCAMVGVALRLWSYDALRAALGLDGWRRAGSGLAGPRSAGTT